MLAVWSKHERAALAQALRTVAKWAFVGSGSHRGLWMPHVLQYQEDLWISIVNIIWLRNILLHGTGTATL